ncbi:MAG: sulfatase [Halanaerobiaceae bacterium]
MKNIILIITDTFRFDNLKNKAERTVRTPELDKFSREKATSIEKFYTGSFPTIPHRTDLATGKWGWIKYGWQSIHKSSSNHIAQILKEQGYNTQLICDCPHLFNSDFQDGFDAAYQHRGQEGDKPLLHLNDNIKKLMPYDKTRPTPEYKGHPLVDQHRWTNRYFETEADTFMAKTSGTAIQWLEENYKAEPFFLWTDFFDPHEPWDPPEYLVKNYDPDYEGKPMLHPNYGKADDYTSRELQNLWAHYAAESELVDRHIGRIIQKIDDLNLWDNSIVIVTSDHGHALGEHNRTGKSNIHTNDDRHWPLYPEISRVPFLIAGKDIPEGQELNLMAQPVDILPTIEELTGLKLQPEEQFEGKSFAKNIIKGKNKHRELVISGSYINSESLKKNSNTPFMSTESGWGYVPVGSMGNPELYDLKNDPMAKNNIAEENENIIEELQHLFVSHLEEIGADENFISLWK